MEVLEIIVYNIQQSRQINGIFEISKNVYEGYIVIIVRVCHFRTWTFIMFIDENTPQRIKIAVPQKQQQFLIFLTLSNYLKKIVLKV